MAPSESYIQTRAKAACDECHSRRVKCSGLLPCSGCSEIGLECTYIRPRHKRGGASIKQRENFIHRRLAGAAERTSSACASQHLSSSPALTTYPSVDPESSPYLGAGSSVDGSDTLYPILIPLQSSLQGILTAMDACHMLQTYFDRSAWGNSFLVRKSSFLTRDPSKIRKTKPTLLYAMLCSASQDHVGSRIEVLDATRGNVTDKLFELAASSVVSFHNLEEEATLDDVICHIQLASILSSSKYQKKSIEWWSATYQLARQLRLNEELDLDISAEEAEERRRTWWLLYCVDRHQALSVRKSVAFRDAECHELRRPCDDRLWNSMDSYDSFRQRLVLPSSEIGLTYSITNGSFFGFNLPLMRILGEIIEVYNLEESDESVDLESKRDAIRRHLDDYDESLSGLNQYEENATEEVMLYKAYARHTVSTLHILSVGKWDPLNVLADLEQSGGRPCQSIIYSAATATIAAHAIREIQRLDARFEFMPLFFGTFVLQCSFPLLLLMKTFGAQSDDNIIGGCETIMATYTVFSRCRERRMVVQQNPYWSSFAAIIDEIKESRRRPATTSPDVAVRTMRDIHSKTREIMGLYRWNKTGHGVNT